VQKTTQQRYKYLQNPIVDDYNIRDDDFYRRAAQMKHISAITGIDEVVDVRKHFAFLPTKLASGKYLWLSDYYVIVRFVSILYLRTINEQRVSYDEYIVMKLSGEIGKTLDQKIADALDQKADAKAMRKGTNV
jgi:hypothetical protein